jgi:hypothetical protein
VTADVTQPVRWLINSFQFVAWVGTKNARYSGHSSAYCTWPGWTDEYGAFGGIKIGRGNRSTARKPVVMPLCPPQIPHDTSRRYRGTKPATKRLAYLQPVKQRSSVDAGVVSLTALSRVCQALKRQTWYYTGITTGYIEFVRAAAAQWV